ncbi:MAG: ABC transporter permease [Planctomycetia bacterium]
MTDTPAPAARPLPPPVVTDGGHAPFIELVRSRLLEFCREPEALFWVYGFPLVMILSLGIAFRQQPLASLRVDVVAGPQAEADVAALAAAPGLTTTIRPQAEAVERLRTGRADLVLERTAGAVEFRSDPTRPEAVLARDRAHDALERAAGRRDLLAVRDTPLDAPGGRYIDFLVPGLMALSLMGGGLWGVGFAVVEMRMRKLLKRFFATPLAHWQFLLGMMTGRMLFVIPEMVLLIVCSRVLFGVKLFGSPAAVVALLALGATAFAGIGLAVAARAKTLEAVSGALNLIMLPMWLGSGVFFSRERYPDWLQPFLAALPLTPLVDALRGVMLEGRTLVGCGWEIATVAAWGIACFTIALRIFRWQ